MTDLYTNLLKATDNTSDITTEKYGTVVKIDGTLCSVKEYDTELEHSNVPIVNGADLKLGDKVIIGFLNNSIYDIVCYGVLDRTVEINWENVQNKPSTFPPSSHNHVSSEVTDLINTIYPIGSIYMSVSSTSPQLLFGGTWEQIKDTFLLASGDTYANGSTGGEATHTLTENEMPSHTHIQDSHNHTQNSHNHTQNSHNHSASADRKFLALGKDDNWAYTSARKMQYSSGSYYYPYSTKNTSGLTEPENTASKTATNQATTATNQATTATNQNTGGGQAHNNMPPYLAVNIWKRTA